MPPEGDDIALSEPVGVLHAPSRTPHRGRAASPCRGEKGTAAGRASTERTGTRAAGPARAGRAGGRGHRGGRPGPTGPTGASAPAPRRRGGRSRRRPTPDATIDTDVLLARFAGAPAVPRLETANCALGHALAQEGLSAPRLRVRAICVGAAGVDFWIAEPATTGARRVHPLCRAATPGVPRTTPSPGPTRRGPCSPSSSRRRGRPRHVADPPRSGGLPPPDGRGGRRPVAGRSGGARVLVLGGHGPGHRGSAIVAEEVRLQGGDARPGPLLRRPRVALPLTWRRRCRCVTLSPAPASDVTVLVDRLAASIHPLGRTVRPHLMTTATGEHDQRARGHPRSRSDDQAAIADVPLAGDGRRAPRPSGRTRGRTASSPARLLPGSRNGRGAAADADPEARGTARGAPAEPGPTGGRAGRLPGPAPGRRGDQRSAAHAGARVLRCRRRVEDAVQHRRRRATRHGRRRRRGMPLSPSGHQDRALPGHRARSRSTCTGRRSWPPRGAPPKTPKWPWRCCAAALSLVEGEPMANALSGLRLVGGRGSRRPHRRRAGQRRRRPRRPGGGGRACSTWPNGASAQARLVDPYSEALSRAAMQVAAAAGDADRLRREWRECQRRIDELDPGSSPSPRTERLYGELAQRVLVGGPARER